MAKVKSSSKLDALKDKAQAEKTPAPKANAVKENTKKKEEPKPVNGIYPIRIGTTGIYVPKLNKIVSGVYLPKTVEEEKIVKERLEEIKKFNKK